jgi:SPP1 family phage portal protein
MSDKILDLINKDIQSKKDRYIGRYYYNYKPTKSKGVQHFIKNGIEYSVKSKDNEIYINYFKMLVTQKIDYLLAKNPTYDKNVSETAYIDIWTLLDRLVLNASLDSRVWLHLYISNGKLTYLIIKDSEIIPFTSSDKKTLEKVIRYFVDDEKLYVELWDKTGVRYIVYDKDKIELSNTFDSHYKIIEYAGENIEKTTDSNFKILPFICLENNKDLTGDIDDIENLIIAYNGICTGFVDNVEKFQEALMILKGYVGETNDMKKVMEKVKTNKGVAVDKDGDVNYMTVDIPVEARSLLLNILRDVIFLIGRGVDPSKLSEGSNITNTVIKSRYIQLDLKSTDCEKRIHEFYKNLINFLNEFYAGNYKTDLTFNKAMLINESEKIDDCLKSLNIISLRTILENHPMVTHGVEEELKRIKEEQKIITEDEDLNTDDIK